MKTDRVKLMNMLLEGRGYLKELNIWFVDIRNMRGHLDKNEVRILEKGSSTAAQKNLGG